MFKAKTTIRLIALMIHETCHLVMALLMYPFGTRVSGVKIICNSKEEKYSAQGSIYSTNTHNLPKFLVATAPFIFYWVSFIYMAFTNPSILLAVFYWLFSDVGILSDADIINMKSAMGLCKPEGIELEKLQEHLQECLNSKI